MAQAGWGAGVLASRQQQAGPWKMGAKRPKWLSMRHAHAVLFPPLGTLAETLGASESDSAYRPVAAAFGCRIRKRNVNE